MKAGEAGTPDNVRGGDGNSSSSLGVSSIFSSTATCPESKTFEAFGRTYELSFQQACDLDKYIKPAVLMMAAVSVAFIVMAAFRE